MGRGAGSVGGAGVAWRPSQRLKLAVSVGGPCFTQLPGPSPQPWAQQQQGPQQQARPTCRCPAPAQTAPPHCTQAPRPAAARCAAPRPAGHAGAERRVGGQGGARPAEGAVGPTARWAARRRAWPAAHPVAARALQPGRRPTGAAQPQPQAAPTSISYVLRLRGGPATRGRAGAAATAVVSSCCTASVRPRDCASIRGRHSGGQVEWWGCRVGPAAGRGNRPTVGGRAAVAPRPVGATPASR